MRDLQHLDRRDPESPRDVALGVGRQQDVGRAEARERDDRVLVRILARQSRLVRPEDAEPETADPERVALVDDLDRNMAPASRRHRRVVVGGRRLDARVLDLADTKLFEHRRRAADVVALRMGEHDRGERADPHVFELARRHPPRAALRRRAPLLPETSSSAESPWPTSRNVTRSPCGGAQDGDGRSAHAPAAVARASDTRPDDRGAAAIAGKAPDEAHCDGDGEDRRQRDRRTDLRRRPAAHDPRDERDPRRAAAGEPCERGCGVGKHRLDRRRRQRQRDQRRHRRLRDDVGRHRPERDGAEVDPDDRRGHEPARDRDDEDVPEPARDRVRVRHARNAWYDDEDRRNRRERQLEPGSSAADGVHARRTSAPTAIACHRSLGLAVIHPSDARIPATAARTTDGCQPTASAYASTTTIARPSPTSRPIPAIRASQTTPTAVIATFCPDTASRCVRPLARKSSRSDRVDPVVLAEHDPGQDRAPLSRRPAGERLLDMRVQPVGDATDPAPPADEARVVAAQHDVDALPRQPRTLVEAGLGPTRRDRLRAQLEDGALRGRPLGRQLEQDALPELHLSEAHDLCRRTKCERRPADRAGDDDARIGALADPSGQDAAVERAFAERAPRRARRARAPQRRERPAAGHARRSLQARRRRPPAGGRPATAGARRTM